jgi:hypothetical protein
MAVGERPPKPIWEWKEAMRRELEKINDEDTIHQLPVDESCALWLLHTASPRCDYLIVLELAIFRKFVRSSDPPSSPLLL